MHPRFLLLLLHIMNSMNRLTDIPLTLTFILLATFMPTLCLANKSTPSLFTPEIKREITTLDSLLTHSHTFVQQKEERLSALRKKYNANIDAAHRYWIVSELYDEYCAYDSDSAMCYADCAINLAHQLNRRDLVDEMELNKAYIYSATGMLTEAENLLARINPDSISTPLALQYCDRMLFLSTHRDQYLDRRYDNTRMYSMQIDSLLKQARKNITPDNPKFIWLMGWSSLSSKKEAAEAIPIVRNRVDSYDYSTRGNAMDAWVLAKLYERIGDSEKYLKYLLLSAQADVRASNKEIASLEEVVQLLYDLGDYEHANFYLNYCISWANEYKSRVRTGRLAELQRKTLGAINESIEHQTKLNRIYIYILIFVLAVLIASMLYILRQNKKLKASRINLSEANAELSSKVDELQSIRSQLHSANEKLHESYITAHNTARQLSEINDSKEQYIANIFTICSNYISSHEEFRANIHKLLTARKFEQAMQLVKSPELSYEEIKQLYANFDKIFLQLYPDFVADFNTLLREEEQISLKKSDTLTTELRIYALVRLGLNDSVKIARFLHCSVQTVYNTRQRTRNKAAIPREEFALRVRSLGKPTL